MEILRRSDFARDPFLREFGLELKSELVKLEGRQLPPPAICDGSISNQQVVCCLR